LSVDVSVVVLPTLATLPSALSRCGALVTERRPACLVRARPPLGDKQLRLPLRHVENVADLVWRHIDPVELFGELACKANLHYRSS
jgi:hypothetical protein